MGIVTDVTKDGFILPSAPNFRDLGGHRTTSGHTVRTGVLFRSDALHSIADEDLPVYHGLGIRQLVDLRTPRARASLPDITPEGAEYAAVAVQDPDTVGANLEDVLADPQAARATFGDGAAERFMHAVYRALVTDTTALEGYRDLVERAAGGPTALVFHCSAGKDRTGWGAALILRLLGVDHATIVADYLVSNGRQESTERWMRKLSANSGLDWEDLAPMTRVRPEYLDTALSRIDEVYGSFDSYVTGGLQISDGTVERLRERMLR
ncbi:tyrosine-protein phosphatase [Nocardiopsis sp. FIRDI 009]|uniref:tyrosine-protein phosphatase n=1 Tax=Nocardiopsis sp. FIRDI 009 TaxID=714197 RepID=UPI000E272DB0|nr:tyrosine-protein phosphatase [Nocardiopsis sp. FIRDI 009]